MPPGPIRITAPPPIQTIIHVEQLDSAGRSPDLVDAMEQNDPKPIRVKGDNKRYADWIAREYKDYPKVMFRLALKEGKPAGDPVRSDPVPLALAEYLGLEGTRLGETFIEKHPYVTKLCGIVRPDKTVDVEASKAQEAEWYAQGWRDSLSKIIGLPKKSTFEEEYDPLPAEMLEQHSEPIKPQAKLKA